jgi:hypothetical protein
MRNDFPDDKTWRKWIGDKMFYKRESHVAMFNQPQAFRDQAMVIAQHRYHRKGSAWTPELARAFHEPYIVKKLDNFFPDIAKNFDEQLIYDHSARLDCYMNDVRSLLVLQSEDGVTVWHWWQTKDLYDRRATAPPPANTWD